MTSTSTSGFPHALKLVAEANHVVLVLGTDQSVEHENHDRTKTTLPGVQLELALEVGGRDGPS